MTIDAVHRISGALRTPVSRMIPRIMSEVELTFYRIISS